MEVRRSRRPARFLRSLPIRRSLTTTRFRFPPPRARHIRIIADRTKRKRGEGTEGYSASLRELEFASAFRAELADYCRSTPYDDGDDGAGPDPGSDWQGVRFTFRDALTYRGPVWNGDDESDGAATDANGDAAAEWEGEPIPPSQVKSYESAMQYVSVSSSRDDLLAADDASSFATRQRSTTLNEVFRSAVRRCSLVRTAFRIVAEAETYEDLAAEACANGSFRDLTEGGTNEDATWSIRLRRYSPSYEATDGGSGGGASAKKHARYGKNVRSPLRDERRAILAMGELVGTFRGRVDLASPECGIYLLEGLRPRRRDNTTAGESSDEREGTALFANGGGAGARGGGVAASGKLLARVVARGPKVSVRALGSRELRGRRRPRPSSGDCSCRMVPALGSISGCRQPFPWESFDLIFGRTLRAQRHTA